MDFKAKLRTEVKLAVMDVLEKEFPFQSCINCNFFSDKEICSIFNARPPAKVIVHGCERWEDKDEIPF